MPTQRSLRNKLHLKCESASRCFQSGEGPSRGLLDDCEILAKLCLTFVWSTSTHVIMELLHHLYLLFILSSAGQGKNRIIQLGIQLQFILTRDCHKYFAFCHPSPVGSGWDTWAYGPKVYSLQWNIYFRSLVSLIFLLNQTGPVNIPRVFGDKVEESVK